MSTGPDYSHRYDPDEDDRGATTNVVREDGVHVCKRMCKTCIFRPGNLMSLEDGRVEQMVADATAMDGCIPCHSTLDEPVQAICRGFYDKHPTQPLQIAGRLGFVVFDDLPEGH